MRTIAILFVLAVIGAALPAASLGYGLLPTAILLFACALGGLLAACLVSGWLLCERRTLGRMTGESPSLCQGRRRNQPLPARGRSLSRTSDGPLDRSAPTVPVQRHCTSRPLPMVARSTARR